MDSFPKNCQEKTLQMLLNLSWYGKKASVVVVGLFVFIWVLNQVYLYSGPMGI